MKTTLACWAVVGLLMAATAGPVRAQRDSAESDVNNAYDIDSMIQQAVENISRRYNLNRSQHEFTQGMMNREVSRFLREHQDEIYPLIRDLTRARFSGQNLTEEQRMRIGKAAKPLIDAAKKAILDANADWRGILSDEQKKLHDWDLREMDGQFETINENFDKMAGGKAVDNPIFPEHKPKTPEPPRPKKPQAHRLPDGPVVERTEAGPFDVCVENFIKDYDLDAAQQEAAQSILREYKMYVQVYRDAHKKEFEGAQQKADRARNTGDIKIAKEAEAEQEKLNARIRQFLDEMRQRLMSIPREAQKNAYEAKKKKSPSASSDQKAPEAEGAKEGDDRGAKPPEPKVPEPKSKTSRRGKPDAK